MAKSKSSASKKTTKTATTTTKSKSTTKSKTATAERKAPVKKTTTKSAAKSAATKKPAAKRAPAGPPAGVPMIDTNLAAQAAASMLINRDTIESAEAAPPPAKESGAFKSLKEQIAKPKPTGLSNIFGPATDLKKSGGHFNVSQQRGHGQTFGGLNKGVPRRTNG